MLDSATLSSKIFYCVNFVSPAGCLTAMLTAGGDPCGARFQVRCRMLLVCRLQMLSDGDQCRSTCWTDRRPCKTTVSKFTV